MTRWWMLVVACSALTAVAQTSEGEGASQSVEASPADAPKPAVEASKPADAKPPETKSTEPKAPAQKPQPASAPRVAPTPPSQGASLPMFDAVQTPWGPGRKSSGEKFSSAARVLAPGPLRATGRGWSLAVGAQYFARGEARSNRDFTDAADDGEFGIDQRARFTLRGSALDRVGVYLEFQDVRGWGSEPNTTTTVADTGLHQGFVDVRATEWLDVRIGRQELSYGEERLIGNLDWGQSARAFDGVFMRFSASTTTVDAFAMMLQPPAWQTAGLGTRFLDTGRFFYGAVARFRPEGALAVDAWALGLHLATRDSGVGAGPSTDVATLGARAAWTQGHLSLIGEGNFQTGRRQRQLVLAGAFAARATYVLTPRGGWYLGAEVLGASGDGDASDDVQGTFDQLFPTGHGHLGYMDYVGWQNVLGFKGTVGFRPFGAHVWLDVHRFQLWDARDASYTAGGATFLLANSGRTAGGLGTEVDLSATVPVTGHFAVAGALAFFFPGGAAVARGGDVSVWGFLGVRAQL